MASAPILNKVGSEGGGRSSGSSEAGSETPPTSDPNPTATKHNGTAKKHHKNVKIHSTTITKSDSSTAANGERFEYSGWVYHLGVNTIGHEYCHFRFLLIRGKYVEMYKRDPSENPGIKPIRRGVIGHTLMLEELGRRNLDDLGDVYVLRFYNRLDESKKGEIACAKAGDARKWMEAFDEAKQQVEYELSRGATVRNKLNMDDEINLEGHRHHRVRRYAHSLKKLVKIGQGPEVLLRKASNIGTNGKFDVYADAGDAVEAHEWKCVRTINGARIFEDVAKSTNGKGVLVKAVAVVDASADAVFEVVLSTDRHSRYEWDTFTGELELIDSISGHFDVVYGTFDPRYLSWRQSKKDFVFSRQWFRGQDGTYTILQFPSVHKKKPPRSGYKRTKINPSTWEISDLGPATSPSTGKSLVTQTLEINPKSWFKWRNKHSHKFEKTVPHALLTQVAGLKEYVGATPALNSASSTTIIQSKVTDFSGSSSEVEDAEPADEFYDAIAADSSSSEDDSDSEAEPNKDKRSKLKSASLAITSLYTMKKGAESLHELNPNEPPCNLDSVQLQGSMRKAKDGADKNCWSCPLGTGFMIRGKTYLKDSIKVQGGEPLLKLIAVDWFKVENTLTKVALHPKCLVQSDAGKKLPFILVINLEVPAKPNYSLVLYYAAERPVKKNSLLSKFIDGTDMFRDSRFKLIPSIIEGYWMVKRAVGSKACLLGKAVTCNYLRQDNFLEIDVDIGSSSVARSVIGLVLGYVTSIVVDLAIVIEAKEEEELPEYILGTVRLNRFEVDSAVALEA